MGFGDFVKKVGTALASGGADLITGTAAAGADIIGQMEANRINRHMARDQMQFQELMSNTAHRREMHDLYAAGLNPILSAKYGGASTPTGASGFVESVTGGRAFSSALEAARFSPQMANLKSDTNLKDKSASKAHQDTLTGSAQASLINQQENESQAREELVDSQKAGQIIQNTSDKADLANKLKHYNVDEAAWIFNRLGIQDLVGSLTGSVIRGAPATAKRASEYIMRKPQPDYINPGAGY